MICYLQPLPLSNLAFPARLHNRNPAQATGVEPTGASLQYPSFHKWFWPSSTPPLIPPYTAAYATLFINASSTLSLPPAPVCCPFSLPPPQFSLTNPAALSFNHNDAQVIGVEPTGANSMTQSLVRGERITLSRVDAFADGVAIKLPGAEPFRLCR